MKDPKADYSANEDFSPWVGIVLFGAAALFVVIASHWIMSELHKPHDPWSAGWTFIALAAVAGGILLYSLCVAAGKEEPK